MKKLLIAVACLALAGVALAQQTDPSGNYKAGGALSPVSPTSKAPAASETSSVAPDAAVITIDGLCERPANSSATPADCKTVITRADFEKLINAIQPNLPPAARKQLANRYVQALFFAEKAHETGLDQGPDFDERMRLAKLQVLAVLGGQQAQQEAAKISDSDIETYYHDHLADYKTISYQRLYVPKQKQMNAANPNANDPELQSQRAATEADMKAEADKLRARAAAGEDILKLQQEAYDFGGNKQVQASTPRVDKARKGSIPPADAAIFELKAGDVSQVFSGSTGFTIYKIGAIEDVPVANVRDEISRKLAGERQKAMMDSLQKSIKLDDAYFNATPATPMAAPTLRNPGEPVAPPASEKK